MVNHIVAPPCVKLRDFTFILNEDVLSVNPISSSAAMLLLPGNEAKLPHSGIEAMSVNSDSNSSQPLCNTEK